MYVSKKIGWVVWESFPQEFFLFSNKQICNSTSFRNIIIATSVNNTLENLKQILKKRMELLESMSACGLWSEGFCWSLRWWNVLVMSWNICVSPDHETLICGLHSVMTFVPQHCSFTSAASCLSYCLSIFGFTNKTCSVSLVILS